MVPYAWKAIPIRMFFDIEVIDLFPCVIPLLVYSKERSSNVQFLDLNSGHNMLSSAAKSISSSGISITPDMVEKTLQNTFPMSPVSLTLIFGPPSLAGLLPWQSIDTEIL